MNQTCKVCGEPAAGFHFGAFTCEGCKSFFGRSYNNLSSISECKNSGKCIIDKKNRTTCKACRLRKCYTVGMSKGGSRYGRRSNWFKIHCLLQEQQQQAVEAAGKVAAGIGSPNGATHGAAAGGFGDMAAAAAAAAAQQHLQQQRNAHLPPHAMSAQLGYGSYLPDMFANSPFAPRHPADAAAAAALPFFSMMNSLPNMATPQSAFQLAPPHLLFPAYHPNAAAAAAAADAAYRSEMYKHRQSVDSAASGESSQRYTPPSAIERNSRAASAAAEEEEVHLSVSACPSPDVCVADEDHHSVVSHHSSQHSISPVSHTIHNPIAIRASPTTAQQQPTYAPLTVESSPVHHQQQQNLMVSNTTTPMLAVPTAASPASPEPMSFAAKMQSLSPVSVCSISGETALAKDQDCPMDLSMKTSRSSVHSFNTSAGDSDVHSDSCSSGEELELRQDARRKFYQLNTESANSSSSSSSTSLLESETVKRQKLAMDDSSSAFAHNFAAAHNANAMRGIFVCV